MNNKIKVMITAIGGPTGHGILKCLCDKENVFVIGIDADINCFSQKLCNKFIQVPKIHEENYLETIESIIEENKIDIVFPTLQDELEWYDEVASKSNVKIAKTKVDDYNTLLDKGLLYERLDGTNCKIHVPRYTCFTGNTELKNLLENDYKIDDYKLLKPCSSHGGIGVMIATNHQNYLDAMNKRNGKLYIEDKNAVELFKNIPQKYMIMEYLRGDEWSVDVLKQKGEYIAVIPRRRVRVSNGIVIDGQVNENTQLIKICKDIVDELGIEGFVNLQFIPDKEGQYKLIDLNPRFCGSQIMSYGAGVNFPNLYILNNVKEELSYPTIKWNTGMKRYWETYYYEY